MWNRRGATRKSRARAQHVAGSRAQPPDRERLPACCNTDHSAAASRSPSINSAALESVRKSRPESDVIITSNASIRFCWPRSNSCFPLAVGLSRRTLRSSGSDSAFTSCWAISPWMRLVIVGCDTCSTDASSPTALGPIKTNTDSAESRAVLISSSLSAWRNRRRSRSDARCRWVATDRRFFLLFSLDAIIIYR